MWRALYLLLSGPQPSTGRNHSQVPPGPAQVAPNCRSLCSSYQVPLDQTQAVADPGLQQTLAKETPGWTYLAASLGPHYSTTQPPPHMTRPGADRAATAAPLKRGQPRTAALPLWSRPVLTAGQPGVSPSH